jgi:hypothetical protein
MVVVGCCGNFNVVAEEVMMVELCSLITRCTHIHTCVFNGDSRYVALKLTFKKTFNFFKTFKCGLFLKKLKS